MNSTYGVFKKYICRILVVVFLIVLVCNSIGVVPRNHVGFLVRAGVVQEHVLNEGWQPKIPFVDHIISISNEVQTTRISNTTVNETAETKDRQLIPVFDFEVQYQIEKEKSFDLYKNYGTNYTRLLVESNAVAIIKQVFSKYDSEEIVNHKDAISSEIAECLNTITSEHGISIVRVNMKNYDFTQEYTALLEERAMLSAQLKNNEIKQNNERISAQTAQDVAIKNAETEAETKRIQAENEKNVLMINAQAKADADKISADNEYYVTTKKAQADKEARLAKAEATKAELEAQAAGLNDLVIQKLFLERWDGEMIPNFGNVSPFTFADFTKIIENYVPSGGNAE